MADVCKLFADAASLECKMLARPIYDWWHFYIIILFLHLFVCLLVFLLLFAAYYWWVKLLKLCRSQLLTRDGYRWTFNLFPSHYTSSWPKFAVKKVCDFQSVANDAQLMSIGAQWFTVCICVLLAHCVSVTVDKAIDQRTAIASAPRCPITSCHYDWRRPWIIR